MLRGALWLTGVGGALTNFIPYFRLQFASLASFEILFLRALAAVFCFVAPYNGAFLKAGGAGTQKLGCNCICGRKKKLKASLFISTNFVLFMFLLRRFTVNRAFVRWELRCVSSAKFTGRYFEVVNTSDR